MFNPINKKLGKILNTKTNLFVASEAFKFMSLWQREKKRRKKGILKRINLFSQRDRIRIQKDIEKEKLPFYRLSLTCV